MSHFYVTLPSNASMDFYPNNTVAKYTTKLANRIELDGEWEVGLVELMYPCNWFNLRDAWFKLCFDEKLMNWTQALHVPNGYYVSPAKLLQDDMVPLMNAVCDAKRVARFEVVPHHFEQMIELSPNLTKIFNTTELITSVELRIMRDKKRFPRIIEDPVSNMFVYCDLLEHVPVGDTLAPLLRCVSTNARQKHGENVSKVFDNPLYLPVQKKSFDSVEINIMSDIGKPVPFTDGRSSVTLHFRRASSAYFL